MTGEQLNIKLQVHSLPCIILPAPSGGQVCDKELLVAFSDVPNIFFRKCQIFNTKGVKSQF